MKLTVKLTLICIGLILSKMGQFSTCTESWHLDISIDLQWKEVCPEDLEAEPTVC